MANTDEHFKILTEIVKSNPKGLCALSEVMQSHMNLSIDPRLSGDPLTALAAVMRHHKMEFKVDAIGSGLFEPSFSVDCADKYDDLFSIDGFLTLTADDIKPEK